MKVSYDLHIHSCLSPCGDLEMTPNNICNMSLVAGLDVIALADHNTARNLLALLEVAKHTKLVVIPGIEVTTSEEVHLLCLFYQAHDCIAFGERVYQALPPIANDPAVFGVQQICDHNDQPVGTLDTMLLNATNLSIEDVCALVKEYHGVIIPAHVDRTSYSIVSNLGAIPKEYGFACVEVKNPLLQPPFAGRIITNSDAHRLEEIADATRFLTVLDKTVAAVLDALQAPCNQSTSD